MKNDITKAIKKWRRELAKENGTFQTAKPRVFVDRKKKANKNECRTFKY